MSLCNLGFEFGRRLLARVPAAGVYVPSPRVKAVMEFRNPVARWRCVEAGADRYSLRRGASRRALLALPSAVRRTSPVSSRNRLEDVRAGKPPEAGRKSLQVHVFRGCARLLGAGALARCWTRPNGYMIRVWVAWLDLERFEGLVRRGRRRSQPTIPERAAEQLRDALELWRGTPLADLAYEPFAQPRSSAWRSCGSPCSKTSTTPSRARTPGELVGQLEALIGEHPYRERLRGQLMLALYRCERQADALQAYQDAREDARR